MPVKTRYTMTPPTYPGLWFRKYGASEKVVEIAKTDTGRLYVVPEGSFLDIAFLDDFAAEPCLWSVYPIHKPSQVDAAKVRIQLGDQAAEIWILDGEILEARFPEEALKAKLARLLFCLYGDVIAKERKWMNETTEKYRGLNAFIDEMHPELRNLFNSWMAQKRIPG